MVYTEKSDVFAFAIMAWEVLSGGKAPWGSVTSEYAIANRVLNGQRPQTIGGLSADLTSLLEQCWAMDPYARPKFITIVDKLKAELQNMGPADWTQLRALYRQTKLAQGLDADAAVGVSSAPPAEAKAVSPPPPPPPSQPSVAATPSAQIGQTFGVPREAARSIIDE